ncbi:MAG: hypothetical protein HOO91_11845 [Bacteroidales bacterium]|nr:hypothetical protein [Bacteroidales bacterium]
MKINRYNYEVFLIDYLDGTLNPSLAGELIVFLEQNPELKNQFDGLEDVVLTDETISYPNKANLKKKSFSRNGIENESEYLYIASIEGEISDKEKVRLDAMVKKDHTRNFDLLLYQKTIIQPSHSIVFPNKTRLKRTSIIPIRYSTLKRSIGIAASIGLLLSIYTIGKILVNTNSSHKPQNNNIIASINPILINPKKELLLNNQLSLVKSLDSVLTKKTPKIHIKSNKLVTNIGTQTTRKEEPIPAKLLSINSKKIVVEEATQNEEIMGLAASYPRHNSFSVIDKNGYADNVTNKSGIREIGIFEILQYGIQSFGKLMGKDVHLNAKKDKNGSIEKLSFESSLIAFSTPMRKKQEGL